MESCNRFLVRTVGVFEDFLALAPLNKSVIVALKYILDPFSTMQGFSDLVSKSILHEASDTSSLTRQTLHSFLGRDCDGLNTIQPRAVTSLLGSCENSLALIMLTLRVCAQIFSVELFVHIYHAVDRTPDIRPLRVENFVGSHRIAIVFFAGSIYVFPARIETSRKRKRKKDGAGEAGTSSQTVASMPKARTRVNWITRDCEELGKIIEENPSSTAKEVAAKFMERNPFSAHHERSIQNKAYKLRRKNKAQTSAAMHVAPTHRTRCQSQYIQRYERTVSDTPSHPCFSCSCLVFQRHLRNIPDTSMQLLANEVPQYAPENNVQVCASCAKKLKSEKVPQGAVLTRKKEPRVLSAVQSLNQVEARLVSIRIPFSQIRELTYEGQYGLRGSIVNVLADVSRAQEVLPRFIDDEGSILVGIKRKLSYQHNYMSGIVRPLRTMRAMKELLETSLYKDNRVTLNSAWMTHIQSLRMIVGEVGTVEEGEVNDEDDEPAADVLLHGIYSSQQVVDTVGAAVHVAPSEGFSPISLFKDQFCEELCFPTLFYGEPRSYHREAASNYQMVAKWELTNKNRKFALNIENLFFKAMKIMIQKIMSSTWVRLRKGKMGRHTLTARDVAADTNIEKVLLSKIGYRDFEQLRTSPDYKEKLKKNVFAMIRQIGPPTFFVTFSAAERLWESLLTAMHQLNTDISKLDNESSPAYVRRLLRSDPVTTARYYVHRFQAMKRLLRSKENILGRVSDYFFVTEFQNRGSQHDHGLLWIDGAPIFEQDPDEAVVRFIDEHISTDQGQLPEHLQEVQTHHHRKTCKKGGKACRFAFPRPPMPCTMILRPLAPTPDVQPLSSPVKKCIKEALARLDTQTSLSFDAWLTTINVSLEEYTTYLRSTIATPTVFLKRKMRDVNTNNFNKQIATLWNANTDIQYILNAYGAASYCTSYMTKFDSSLTRAIKNEFEWCVANNASTIERLRKTGNAILKAQQLSSQQAVYIALSMPLSSSSRKFTFINTSPPDQRTLLLKRKAMLARIEQDSTDIFYPDIIHKYILRPERLSMLCLADFVGSFECSGNTHKKRKSLKILRSVQYNKQKDPENYYREQCLLYLPFRTDENENMGSEQTWHDVYAQHMDIVVQNEAKFNKHQTPIPRTLGAQTSSESQLDSDVPSIGATNSESFEYDLGLDIATSSAKSSLSHAIHRTYEIMSNHDYHASIRKLNREQRLIFDDIMLRKRKHPHERLHLFLTGGAGTGKTFTLLLVVQGLLRHYNTSTQHDANLPTALLMAYTGKAAFNIGGTTIHSALHMPLVTSAQTMLSGEKLDTLSKHYKSLQLAVFDEVSLIGLNTFRMAESRLRSIKHTHDKPFGGLDVVLCGDLCQASPVRDAWIFKKDEGILAEIAPTYWHTSTKCYELTMTMRQTNQDFIEALNRIRIGRQTNEDLQYLNTTFYRTPPRDLQITYLYYTNNEKDKHNEEVFQQTPGVPRVILARDTRHRSCSKRIQMPKDAKATGGLHSVLNIKPSIIVELCAGNLDILDGLVNGAEGIFWDSNLELKDPVVWVQFLMPQIGAKARYESRHLYSSEIPQTWTPLHRVTREFQIGKNKLNTVTRKQFPIQPAAARTIHRSQGLTMTTLAVSPKNIKSHGLLYTALSRIKDPSNLYLLEKVQNNQIKVDHSVLQEMHRLRTSANWVCCNKQFDRASTNHIVIQSLNTSSLRAHILDIEADASLMASDILCLQETRLQACDTTRLQGFHDIRTCGPHGVAIHYKPHIRVEKQKIWMAPGIEIAYGNFWHPHANNIQIITIYKSPTVHPAILFRQLHRVIQEIDLDMHVLPPPLVVLGDFNIDAGRRNHNYKKLEDVLSLVHLKQHIDHPTTIYGSTIDHIWTNIHSSNTIFGTNYCYWSDHSILYMQMLLA